MIRDLRGSCAASLFITAVAAVTTAVIILSSFNVSADASLASSAASITTAAVNDSSKSFTITEQNKKGVVIEKPEYRMFWEKPRLTAGMTREGSFEIINKTKKALDLSLSTVELPFDNEKALKYLLSLHIKVASAEGQTLYDGKYGNISGEDGAKISFPSIGAGKTAGYKVTLSCPFNYTGDPENESAPVRWNIVASTQIKQASSSNNGATFLGVCLTILILSVLFLVIPKKYLTKIGNKK